jgi:3-hydroxy-3-methylglutaryl CoA synthase
MSPEIVGVIIGSSIALAGSAINAIVIVKNNNRTRESEERKHYRDLLFRVGFDWWKHDQDSPDVKVKNSLEVYLPRMDAFFTLYVEENPNLEKAMKKQAAFGDFLDDEKKPLKQPPASPDVT